MAHRNLHHWAQMEPASSLATGKRVSINNVEEESSHLSQMISTIDSSCPLPRRSTRRALATIPLRTTILQIESSMRLRVIQSSTKMSIKATIPVISKSMPHCTFSQEVLVKIKVLKSLSVASPRNPAKRPLLPIRDSLRSLTPPSAQAPFAPASQV